MAVNFDDASSQKIGYGDPVALHDATQFCGHAWVNLDDLASDHYIYSTYHSSSRGILFTYDLVGSASGRDRIFTIFYQSTGGTIRVEGATDSAHTSGWQSVGFSIDTETGGVINLWIDGVKDANSGSAADGVAGHLSIGDDLTVGSRGSSAYMDGQLAAPAIWRDGILSDDDFVALSKGVDVKLIRPDLLIFHAPLIREYGDVIGGLTGTPSGSPTISNHPPIIQPSSQILQFPTPAAASSSVFPILRSTIIKSAML